MCYTILQMSLCFCRRKLAGVNYSEWVFVLRKCLCPGCNYCPCMRTSLYCWQDILYIKQMEVGHLFCIIVHHVVSDTPVASTEENDCNYLCFLNYF